MNLTDEQKTFLRSDFGDFAPFLEKTDFARDALLLEMEKQFEEMQVYSVGPWFGRLLNILLRFARANRVLELGTATGYSAVWMGRALASEGQLVTIERDPELAEIARINLAKAGLLPRVDLRVADAAQVLPELTEPFDAIFVDCAHLEVLASAEWLLRSGGLFICDNVGFSNKDEFNSKLTACQHLETLYLHAYLKGRVPENAAFSLSLRV